ncbi:E3 ubiquitin-protein ligase TRIM71-like isoform X2 [Mytilus trossulus]
MEARQCESCLREDSKVCAEFYCFDCEEPLCSSCLKNHKKNKFLMSHHTVDLDFIEIFPTSTLSKITHCAKHGDGRVDLFCTDHEALCCRHCMTESHRSCKSILPIDIAAREIRSSPLSSMLTQDLTLFLQTLNTLITNREETGKTFEKDVEEIRSQVKSFKGQVIDHVDRLEKSIIDNLQDFCVEEKEGLQHEKDYLLNTRKSYHKSKSDLDVVIQHGSDSQIFLFAHNLAHRLANDETLIQSKAMMYKDVSVEFKPENGLQDSIQSIGTLNICKQPCLLRSFSQNRRQAQVITRPVETKTQFLYRSQIDISVSENVQITAIAVTNDNRLILCNRYSNRLLVYSDSGKFLQDCTLFCKPWDIAILPDGNRGVVTLPLENSIQFLNISNMTTDKEQISIHNKCHGVAVVSNFIVVGANRELYILAMDGSIRTRVQVPGQLIYFLHGGDNNSVYYTDYHCLYHVGLDGEEIFRYDNPDLKVPEGIARDNQGYLCVIGRGSQNVHRVGDNGRAIDIVLNRDDGVILPWAITFNNKGTKAFISTHDGKCISVYDIHIYTKQKGILNN